MSGYTIDFQGDVKKVMASLNQVQSKAKSISQTSLINNQKPIQIKAPVVKAPELKGFDIKSAGLDAISTKLGGITSQFGILGKAIPMALNPITLSIGALLGAITYSLNHLKSTIANTVPQASDFEQFETIFKPILGDSEKAKQRIEELVNFAASTPFQIEGISKASKVLETLTAGALSTGNGLRMVGDMASVANVPLEELSSTVGRLYSNVQGGNSSGEELRRLQELGLLSTNTKNKVLELQKAGASGSEVWSVLAAEFKKVEGAMAELSTTHKGLQSTLEDNINIGKAKHGKAYLEAEKNIIEGQIEQQKIKNRLIDEESDMIETAAYQWEMAGESMNDVGLVLDLIGTKVGSIVEVTGTLIANIAAGLANMTVYLATFGMSETYGKQQRELQKSIEEGERLKAAYEEKVKEREAQKRIAQEAELKRLEDLKAGYKKVGDEISKSMKQFNEKVEKNNFTNDELINRDLNIPNFSKLFIGGFDNANMQEVDTAIQKLNTEMLRLQELQKNQPGLFSEQDKKSFDVGLVLIDRLITKKKELFDLENKKVKDDAEVLKIQNELNLLEKKNELLRLQNKTNLTEEESWEKSNLEDMISTQEKLTAIQEYKLTLIEKYNLKEAEALAIAERKYKLENDNKNLEAISSKKPKNDSKNNEQKIVTSILDKLRDLSISNDQKHGNGIGGIPQIDVSNQILRNLQNKQISLNQQQVNLLSSIDKKIGNNTAVFA